MTAVARVKLWGRTIGAITLADGADHAEFAYDAEFVRSGIEVAPLMMPLSTRVYSFPALSRETFHGLPGLLADSLPDKFGNALIDAWLARQGREPGSFHAIERLCYTGARGMGALEFEPAQGPKARRTARIQVDELVALAAEILAARTDFKVSFAGKVRDQTLQALLQVGTSAGGARAKAVIAWNPATNEVRSGQIPAGPGFEYWLLKFDGVKGNRDQEITDPLEYCVIEYAYTQMAIAAGIEMSVSRLFHEQDRRHYMTRRFDRHGDGKKIHMQSLCALAHLDFNLAGAHSYEQALLAMRKLGLPMSAIEQQYRRMVFNIVARNQDDHVKNISFLMDKAGRWSLAPAYDLTYSNDPANMWMARHQMTLNGKRDDFSLEDFKACANTASMKRGRGEKILMEVISVAGDWKKFADAAGVSPIARDGIQSALRLSGF